MVQCVSPLLCHYSTICPFSYNSSIFGGRKKDHLIEVWINVLVCINLKEREVMKGVACTSACAQAARHLEL